LNPFLRADVDAARQARFEIDASEFGFGSGLFESDEAELDRALLRRGRTNNRRDRRAAVAAHAPRRQILLFHGIVNSRRRVLMPVPSRPGTHEISVLRLLAVPLFFASLFIAARRQASRATPNAPVIDAWSGVDACREVPRGSCIRDDSVVKKFRQKRYRVPIVEYLSPSRFRVRENCAARSNRTRSSRHEESTKRHKKEKREERGGRRLENLRFVNVLFARAAAHVDYRRVSLDKFSGRRRTRVPFYSPPRP